MGNNDQLWRYQRRLFGKSFSVIDDQAGIDKLH